MRARVLVLVVAAVLGVGAWSLLTRSESPRSRATETPVVALTERENAPPTTTAAFVEAPSQPAPPSDAEQLLRTLEPLAVTDKPRALELALAADRRLPADGVPAEARRALIVTLLVDSSRLTEARSRAREFFRQYGSSRYVPLVRGVTGLHERPPPSQLRDAR